MRLRRVYETAEEEGRPVEEVALDRFESLELFEQARDERRILDERDGRRGDRHKNKGKNRDRPPTGGGGESRITYMDIPGSGTSSRKRAQSAGRATQYG